MAAKLAPIHPGEVLMEDFLKPLELTQARLARDLGLSARHINDLVLGKRRVDAETALRLARHFGNTPHFWLGLQADYDLDLARKSLGKRLRREVKVMVIKSLR